MSKRKNPKTKGEIISLGVIVTASVAALILALTKTSFLAASDYYAQRQRMQKDLQVSFVNHTNQDIKFVINNGSKTINHVVYKHSDAKISNSQLRASGFKYGQNIEAHVMIQKEKVRCKSDELTPEIIYDVLLDSEYQDQAIYKCQ